MRYSAQRKQETRQRVLRAAANQIRLHGPHGFSLATVMAEVGLTSGGFYAHFPSKDDFLAAAVEQMFEDGPSAILRGVDGETPTETLSRFVDYYLSKEHRDTRTAGCPLPFLSGDALRLSPELRLRIAKGVNGMNVLVKNHLIGMGHSDPQQTTLETVPLIIGAVILARAETDAKRSAALLASTRKSVQRHFGL